MLIDSVADLAAVYHAFPNGIFSRPFENVIAVTGVMLATLAVLALLIAASHRLRLVDKPDGERKRHARPTPLVGGLAVMAVATAGTLASADLMTPPVLIVLALAVVAVFHAIDDACDLSPSLRFAIDGALATLTVLAMGQMLQYFADVGGVRLDFGWLALPITVFVFLSLSNAYNMIDGVDGLFLTQFLISVAAISLWGGYHDMQSILSLPMAFIVIAASLVLMANIGALGAFLKCFLGDSGARALSFALIGYGVSFGSDVLPPVIAAFFFAVPMLDMCVVGAKRIRRGVSPMRADRTHLHHVLMDNGLSRQECVAVMGLMSISFAALAFALEAVGASDGVFFAVFMALTLPYWLRRDKIVGTVLRRRNPVIVAE